MWDVWDVGCSGCGMFKMWDVQDVRCSGCEMFGMWDVRDVGCGMFAGMWDVDLQNVFILLLLHLLYYLCSLRMNLSNKMDYWFHADSYAEQCRPVYTSQHLPQMSL